MDTCEICGEPECDQEYHCEECLEQFCNCICEGSEAQVSQS